MSQEKENPSGTYEQDPAIFPWGDGPFMLHYGHLHTNAGHAATGRHGAVALPIPEKELFCGVDFIALRFCLPTQVRYSMAFCNGVCTSFP